MVMVMDMVHGHAHGHGHGHISHAVATCTIQLQSSNPETRLLSLLPYSCMPISEGFLPIAHRAQFVNSGEARRPSAQGDGRHSA